jgi:serine/threonine/tyrosine protein kinase RAD53
LQINGAKIGKDKTAVLKEGNEIAFGSPHPQPGDLEDYRELFTFMLMFAHRRIV